MANIRVVSDNLNEFNNFIISDLDRDIKELKNCSLFHILDKELTGHIS